MTEHHPSWMTEHTNTRKHRQTTKQQQQQQQHRQRQTSHSSTAVRYTGHHRSNAQPNYYNPTRGWQALKRWLPALTSPVRCCSFKFSLHTSKVHRSKKESSFCSRLSKLTHRSSTICPLMNISSCGGNHPRLISISLIFSGIFCRRWPLCPV